MAMKFIMNNNKISKYRLSIISGIPYSTLSDIVEGKTQLNKCSAETVYKLSKALNIGMESLLASTIEERCDFELFKSNVCHNLKRLGDINFIRETLLEDNITKYYNNSWYFESFYLLAMLDYVSRVNNIKLCNRYNELRHQTLEETVYPRSILLLAEISKDEAVKEKAREDSIKEFLHFNIVESEVRNIV